MVAMSGRAVRVAAIGGAIGSASRLFSCCFLCAFSMGMINPLPMMADILAMVCLLALVEDRLTLKHWYQQLIKRNPGYSIVNTVGMFGMNTIRAVLVHRAILNPGDLLGRLLNSRPLYI